MQDCQGKRSIYQKEDSFQQQIAHKLNEETNKLLHL
jgi:hypothetical protein